MNLAYNIYSKITFVLGIVLEIYLLFLLIFITVHNVKARKVNKILLEKMKNSNMFEDIFGKMTDEEKEEFEKTGKVTSNIQVNIDNMETSKQVNKDKK